MEGIVAKRTLRKSYYNNRNIGYTGINAIPYAVEKNNTSKGNEKSNKNIFEKYKEKVLYKLSIQAITMISIIAFVILVKYFNIQVVIESDITKKITNYYQKNYSSSQILNGVKHIAKSTYIFAKPIIPENIETKVKELYKVVMTKQEKTNEITEQIPEIKNNGIEEDSIKENSEVKVYEEDSTLNKESETNKNIGASVDDEYDSEKIVAVSSSVSSEIDIVNEIKETNIKFVKPVSGTITSHFGAREVIFEGVDSYHTGTDIAANTGTKVVSSIEGTVTRATYNKYNGNFVEVKNGKIKTIYCHMSKLTVKVGDSVKSGTKIGEVGSTGLSTGPHLHFEIVYNETKVDPELILDL